MDDKGSNGQLAMGILIIFVLAVAVAMLIATIRAPSVFGQIAAGISTVCFIAAFTQLITRT